MNEKCDNFNSQIDRQQYPVVDLLKYICALLVVSIHIAPLSSFFEVIPLTTYLNYGIQNYIARLAVPFYFAAAGFFLFRESLNNSPKLQADPQKFEKCAGNRAIQG